MELGGDPVVTRLDPAPGAQTLDCFIVIDRLVAEHGGERLLGWRIWEYVGWLEAAFTLFGRGQMASWST